MSEPKSSDSAAKADKKTDVPAKTADKNDKKKQPDKGTPKKSGFFGTGLALLLGVAALGLALYVGWQQQTLLAIPADVATSQTNVSKLQQNLNKLGRDMGAQMKSFAAKQQQLELATQKVDTFSNRLTGLEGSLAQLALIDDDTRTAWLSAEAEYYLRIANEQLQLAGDPVTAARALQMADDKLRDLASPTLTPVRAQIGAELAALKALPVQDRVGTIVTLQALSASLSSLPLRQVSPERFTRNGYAVDENASGLDRAIAAVKSAFAKLVNVKRDGVTLTPQLTSAEEALLVRSVDLELQVAGLAFLRGEAALYRASIDSATERLSQFFDLESGKVQSTLNTLQTLSAIKFPEALPEISESLELLLKLKGRKQ